MNNYEALLRLQEIDLSLMRLNRTLKGMPQQKKLAQIDQAKKKLAVELKKILGQRKDAEIELADSEAEYNHCLELERQIRAEAQKEGVTYREAADIEQQLTHLAKKLEKIEFAHDSKVELAEKLRRAEANAHGLAERLDAEAKAQREAYDKETGDLMAEVRKLAAERKQALEALSSDEVAAYERASMRFDGLAVEHLMGNVPSVCRVKLQPSAYADIRAKGPISECPYCHRLIVTEEVAQ